MIEYHVNRLAYSRRAIILAFLCCMIVFIFIWQGVESMLNEFVDHKNTIVRIAILLFMLSTTIALSIYFWLSNVHRKMNASIRYAETVHDTADAAIRKEYEEIYAAGLAEMSALNESLEWEKRQYNQLISKKANKVSDGVVIPIDYSMDRNRIVFIQQKGANGQTAYEFAYYEVINGKLIVGKANFKRKLFSTQDKRDSMNRMIGVEDVYMAENIKVYKQFEIELINIPEPYKTAVQLGALKTETVISMAKNWASNNLEIPTHPLTKNEDSQYFSSEDSNTISFDLI